MKFYKIAIGMRLQNGPWGGGNQFGKSISSFLKDKGWKVVYNLKDKDIDLILLTDPRKNLQSCAFNDKDILKYLIFKNSKALVVHRVNECDERKGTKGVNKGIIKANDIADCTIFISSWLSELFGNYKKAIKPEFVVLNGGDTAIFNNKSADIWRKKKKLKLATHHWGAGWLKGFDVYKKLDYLLGIPKYANKFEFTYIGNIPTNFQFKNSNYILPKSGKELALELKKNHVYLTGSQNEPAGMHHIEGALCGLPLLYRESGALSEYCKGYGISFTFENLEEKLNEMYKKYNFLKPKMKSYPFIAERMCSQYYKIFLDLLENKDDILQKRKIIKKPLFMLKSFLH